jgi:hypothetical protein
VSFEYKRFMIDQREKKNKLEEEERKIENENLKE